MVFRGGVGEGDMFRGVLVLVLSFICCSFFFAKVFLCKKSL